MNTIEGIKSGGHFSTNTITGSFVAHHNLYQTPIPLVRLQ
jgi:hypothetical protein